MGCNLFVIGVSWRTAAVGLREKLAFRDDELPGFLSELRQLPYVGEAMLISTCNRVEIYGATERSSPVSALDTATAEVVGLLRRSRGVESERLAGGLYEYTDNEAIRHVFRVAAALDSMVLGEAQILGQVKAAYGTAVNQGATGPILGRCLERAFSVAKRVRNETGVSRGAANVSSVAVELAKRVFVDLGGKTVLVVGAGKMSALAARHLHSAGAGTILVTNRSPVKAEALANEIDGVARPWGQLETLLCIADVVITSTGAREPVLTRKLLQKVAKKRRYRSLVLIDIAVPRDVEDSVGTLDGVYLFDIDDLQRVVASNLEERAREADNAARIVDAEVLAFESWLRSQRVVPTIRALREHFIEVATSEVDRTLQAMVSEEDPQKREQAVRRLGDIIVKKLLHAPMTALKAGDERDIETLVAATHRLFPLVGQGEDEDARSPRAATAPPTLGEGEESRGQA